MLGVSRCIAIELLDEILSSKFGFHFLEPVVEVKEVPIAKLLMAKQPYSAQTALKGELFGTNDTAMISVEENID